MSEMQSVYTVREDNSGIRQFDTAALLAGKGILFLRDTITSESVGAVIEQMLYCAGQGIPVSLHLDSPGGQIRAGMELIDVIRLLQKRVPIDIVCTGRAYSMAALILAAPGKGHRRLLPHAEVMIHEPLIERGAGGSASSVKSTAEALLETRDMIAAFLAECTGRSPEELSDAMSCDHFFTAQEAIAFGLADAIADTL